MQRSASPAWRIVSAGALFAPLLALTLAACGDRNLPGRIELVECRLPKLAAPARCGIVSVPEDRTKPGGRRIPVAVAVLPANTLSPKADPLIMLAGGPGQSSAALAPLAGLLGGVRRNRDIVLIDPRGTGKSSPLSCPALASRDAFDEFAETDAPASAAQRCLAELKSTGGPDLAHYTTADYVADIDDVRDGLGYDRVNLWGGSYGTRAALEYLRRHPERVRSVVLDGVVPPDMRLMLDDWPAREAALASVFAACADSTVCRRAVPDLDATLVRIRNELGAGRRVSIVDPRTGAPRTVRLSFDIVVAALDGLLYTPETAALIPPLLARAEIGDFAPLAAASLLFTEDVTRTMNVALLYAVTCADDVPRVTAGDVKRALAMLRAPALAEHNLAACDGWPRPPLPPDFSTPVTSDKPVLILSGGLDPVTPPANGQRVAATLPNSRHVIAAGYGHIVSAHACAPRLIEKFIDDAGFDALPQSCLDYFAASARPPLFASLLR